MPHRTITQLYGSTLVFQHNGNKMETKYCTERRLAYTVANTSNMLYRHKEKLQSGQLNRWHKAKQHLRRHFALPLLASSQYAKEITQNICIFID